MAAVVPFIPLILGGISAFSTIKGLFSGGPKPPTDTTAAAKPPDDTTLKKEEILGAAPSVQERLGGSVAPEFFATEAARVSGNAGDTDLAKQVLSQYLGLGSSPDKQGISSNATPESGGNNFNPLAILGGGSGGQASKEVPPGFFESLLNEGGGGGDGMSMFSGGSA